MVGDLHGQLMDLVDDDDDDDNNNNNNDDDDNNNNHYDLGPVRFLLYAVHSREQFHPLGGTGLSSPKSTALPKPGIPPYAVRTLHIRGVPSTVYNCQRDKPYRIHILRC